MSGNGSNSGHVKNSIKILVEHGFNMGQDIDGEASYGDLWNFSFSDHEWRQLWLLGEEIMMEMALMSGHVRVYQFSCWSVGSNRCLI